jgi:hypothetical protein
MRRRIKETIEQLRTEEGKIDAVRKAKKITKRMFLGTGLVVGGQ